MDINQTISIIIPIHKLDGERELKMAKKAVTSVLNQKTSTPATIVLVHGPEVSSDSLQELNRLVTKKTKDIQFVQVRKQGETDFASMVNEGVSQLKTPYFSILEFDDEFTDIYFGYVQKYLVAYPEVSLLLPIVAETNLDDELMRYSNEVPWVQDFSTEAGVLSHESLLEYAGINLTGAVISVDKFNAVKGLKTNLPVVFNYEFLLRLTNQEGNLCLSIPKIGYLHKNGRENALFASYMKGKKALTAKELNFWFETAKKEFEFLTQRPVTANKE
jgi:hypothetical protein